MFIDLCIIYDKVHDSNLIRVQLGNKRQILEVGRKRHRAVDIKAYRTWFKSGYMMQEKLCDD